MSAALLLGIAITSFLLSRRVDAHRMMVSEALEPAARQLTQFRLAFLDAVAAWRSYQIRPGEARRERVLARHRNTRGILDEMGGAARRVDADYMRQVATLRGLVDTWEVAPLAVLSGRMSMQTYRQSAPVPEQQTNNVNNEAARIGDSLSSQLRRQIAEMRQLERNRLRILAGLFPVTLLGIVTTAWFARRAMLSQGQALRNARYEAVLRDTMAALTGEQVLPEALNRIVGNAMRLSNSDGAFIEHIDEGRTVAEIAAATGAQVPRAGTTLPFAESLTNRVVRIGGYDLNVDLSEVKGDLEGAVADRLEHGSVFAVAMLEHGDIVGVLALTRRDWRGSLREETVSRLRALAAWAALAVRRQRLAAQLAAEAARLEAVIGEMPVGVVLAEAPSGRLALFNRQAVELWGSPPRPPQNIEEYADWKLFRMDGAPYSPQDRPLARSILNGEIVKGEEAEIEARDGRRRVVLINSAPVRNEQGAIIAGVGTVTDISQEKAREQTTRFLDEISRQLASTLDYDATVEAVLRLMVPRLGNIASIHHRPDNSLIRSWAAVVEDPDVEETLRQIEEEYPLPLPSAHPISVAVRTGQPQLRERVDDELLMAIARDERQLNWLRSLGICSAMAVPLTVRGKTTGALQIMSLNQANHYDCDDLILAEEIGRRVALAIDNAKLFRTLTETGNVSRFLAETALTLSASLEYDEVLQRVSRLAVPFFADFTFAFVKDARGVAQLVASAHRDSSKKPLLAEAARLHRVNPSNMGSTVERVMSTGQPVLVEKVTAELMESEHFEPEVRQLIEALAPVSLMTVPLVARDETLGVIVFGSTDHGRRYEAKELALGQRLASRAALAVQNALLYRKAQEALNTRDEVLAIVSHDLRNPLNTIDMSVQMLEDMPLEETDRRRQLEMIGRAKDRMSRLIQDLLDVTRVEAGKSLVIERRRERPSAFVAEACESFVVPASEKSVHLQWIVSQDTPDVMVDCDRIVQVLCNLISNAIKFTPEGGKIEVLAEPYRDMVRVRVRDTGWGIPPEDLERIFHPFWQAPRTEHLGAGLGLAISRAIVEQHGGRVWVESREGEGSTFFFTLPVADAQTVLRAAD